MENDLSFQIGIKKIKDLEFSAKEEIQFDSDFSLDISQHTNFNLTEKTIEIILTLNFSSQNNEIFLHSKTSNVFHVPGIEKFKNHQISEKYNLPEQMLIMLIGLSISHSRALIAKNSLGTKFSEVYLPIVNPGDLIKHLYP